MVCCFSEYLLNLTFRGHWKIMKIGLYHHHYHFCQLLKNFTLRFHFCFVWYFISYILFFSQINSFYFKIKYFSQKNHFKNLFQKLIRVLRIKISFFFLFKNNMQPYLVRFGILLGFQQKNFGFEQRHESKLVVPNNGIILG